MLLQVKNELAENKTTYENKVCRGTYENRLWIYHKLCL